MATVLHDDTIAMLYLLYERSKGQASSWSFYFQCIPSKFHTAYAIPRTFQPFRLQTPNPSADEAKFPC